MLGLGNQPEETTGNYINDTKCLYGYALQRCVFLGPVQIRLRRDQPRPGSGILDLSYADSTQANQGETVSAG